MPNVGADDLTAFAVAVYKSAGTPPCSALIGDLCSEAHARDLTVEGVGLGLPGLVDVEQGMQQSSAGAHLADFHGVPLAERISAKTGVLAVVDNDVNETAKRLTPGPRRYGSCLLMTQYVAYARCRATAPMAFGWPWRRAIRS
ncbi:MAG: hypothetical protein ACREKS_06780 [Candidatus Rokuibacteriota bacterium]